jgi:NAD+ synthase
LKADKVANYIQSWLEDYLNSSGLSGFMVGISGGVDSALVSKLCALTGKKTLLMTMPIRQTNTEYTRALKHMEQLKNDFPNVELLEIDLTPTFEVFEKAMPFDLEKNHLAMANSRSRLRMTTLYAIAQANGCIVVGTGNKVEDFGVGFYTKYGDGGVDISPIADINKTQVFELARYIGVIPEILEAKPTDGLFEDGRSDEDQMGATYPELEWAMEYSGDESDLSIRQQEVLRIYRRLNRINQHKMQPIPVCLIPKSYI